MHAEDLQPKLLKQRLQVLLRALLAVKADLVR